ncbi:MAG TPA: APC family permease [Candidatus Dormibacteraeota bacterium]|nr:APC family permease [Candidatus Dormibacteraeota bacterium]
MADLEERRPERGRKPGERIVRIVRPKDFRVAGKRRYELTEHALVPETRFGRAVQAIRRVLIGRPLRSEAETLERVSKKVGLALFAPDNITSSAYATEEIMRVLALAGIAALNLTEPMTAAVIAVLAIVIVSEIRVIHAYPQGGGSYQVASENLGMFPGLLAGSALLIDYTLTIAVSTAAGVAALSSAFPPLHEHRVLYAIGLIAVVWLANLRGVRESGLLFAGPTYLYLASYVALVGYGAFLTITSGLPAYEAPPAWVAFYEGSAEPLAAFLILRAFSSGAVALTGVEAIGNSVPAFKKPEPRNASITLVVMGICFAFIFGGLSVIGGALNIVPDPKEAETVNSQITRTLIGVGPFYYLIQSITALLLLFAANTSFSGFPRLASILARDRFLPRQFAFRGDRLAYSTGIGAVAVLSCAILAAFGGSVTRLIPLYTIGVFVAFTLSQAGLVRRWWRLRNRYWRLSIGLNTFGAAVTGIVAVIVAVTKFEFGAWMVLVAMPILVAVFYGIHRHYQSVEDALALDATPQVEAVQPVVVVPVSRIDRAAVRALSFAKGLSADVRAVHITDDEDEAKHLEQRFEQLIPGVKLETLISPYRALLGPLQSYLDAIDRGDPRRPITVVLAEFVPRHWWEYALHNQTALRIKLALFFRPNTVVIDVPYHLEDEERHR